MGAVPLMAVRTKPLAVPEKVFQAQVVELAQMLGWTLAHFRPAQDRYGRWKTAMTGDPGYPDLTLVRDEWVLFVECKRDDTDLKPDQRVWMEKLGRVAAATTGVGVYVWRPRNMDGRDVRSIADVLRHPGGGRGIAGRSRSSSGPRPEASPR